MATWEPLTWPETPELIFNDVPSNTARELEKLKKELAVEDTKTTGEHSEWNSVKTFFETEKSKIKSISRTEINELKAAIVDTDTELWELKVDTTGKIEYTETVATPAKAPTELTPAIPPITEETDPTRAAALAYLTLDSEKEAFETVAPQKLDIGKWIGKFFWEMLMNLKKMLGIDTRNEEAKIEWYTDFLMKQKAQALLSALTPYTSAEWLQSLKWPEGDKEKEEELVKMVETAWIPMEFIRTSLSYILSGDPEILSKPRKGVNKDTMMVLRGKFLTDSEDEEKRDMSPRDKLIALFETTDPFHLPSDEETENYRQRAQAELDAAVETVVPPEAAWAVIGSTPATLATGLEASTEVITYTPPLDPQASETLLYIEGKLFQYDPPTSKYREMKYVGGQLGRFGSEKDIKVWEIPEWARGISYSDALRCIETRDVSDNQWWIYISEDLITESLRDIMGERLPAIWNYVILEDGKIYKYETDLNKFIRITRDEKWIIKKQDDFIPRNPIRINEITKYIIKQETVLDYLNVGEETIDIRKVSPLDLHKLEPMLTWAPNSQAY